MMPDFKGRKDFPEVDDKKIKIGDYSGTNRLSVVDIFSPKEKPELRDQMIEPIKGNKPNNYDSPMLSQQPVIVLSDDESEEAALIKAVIDDLEDAVLIKAMETLEKISVGDVARGVGGAIGGAAKGAAKGVGEAVKGEAKGWKEDTIKDIQSVKNLPGQVKGAGQAIARGAKKLTGDVKREMDVGPYAFAQERKGERLRAGPPPATSTTPMRPGTMQSPPSTGASAGSGADQSLPSGMSGMSQRMQPKPINPNTGAALDKAAGDPKIHVDTPEAQQLIEEYLSSQGPKQSKMGHGVDTESGEQLLYPDPKVSSKSGRRIQKNSKKAR